MNSQFKSQAARDAERMSYGDSSYWKYLDDAAKEASEYFKKRGNDKQAERMLTRSLAEALQGNDGK